MTCWWPQGWLELEDVYSLSTDYRQKRLAYGLPPSQHCPHRACRVLGDGWMSFLVPVMWISLYCQQVGDITVLGWGFEHGLKVETKRPFQVWAVLCSHHLTEHITPIIQSVFSSCAIFKLKTSKNVKNKAAKETVVENLIYIYIYRDLYFFFFSTICRKR